MIYIIHIGKCGGGSLTQELKKNKIKYICCHCNKPIIKNNFKYTILIRDPINRFISAFNWNMFRSTTEEGYNFQGMKIQSNIKEVSAYFNYWKNINNFAENLYDKYGNINDMALKLIKNSRHLNLNINYYLQDILSFLNTDNCNIIRYEYYNDDIKSIFDIKKITSRSHIYNKQYSKYISYKGIQNLRIFLNKDYNCIKMLREKKIINEEYYQNLLSGKFYVKNI